MKKFFLNTVFKRLKSKNPKFFNVLSIIAGALIAIFFGADQVFDLCDFGEWLCNNSAIIYTILGTIVGMSQLPVSDKSKEKIKTD